MDIRKMEPSELERIREIDRAEIIQGMFKCKLDGDKGLALEYEALDKPIDHKGWTDKGVDDRIGLWKPYLDDGGIMFGAFDVEQFAGFSITSKVMDGSVAELVALFIHKDYRRSGLGAQLLERSEVSARENGAKEMSAASNPTASSYSFYAKHGYKLTSVTVSGTNPAIIRHHYLPELLLSKSISYPVRRAIEND